MRDKVLLKVNKISKKYKSCIFENLDFNIYESEIFGIFGLSGTGKTTLLKLLSGYLNLSSGSICYNVNNDLKFKDINNLSYNYRSKIGFASQNSSFYSDLTVFENLEYFGFLNDVSRSLLKEKIEEVVKILELESCLSFLASDLSEGMKKRLDIACSLIYEPEILILDEPTANLDFKLREELIAYVKKIHKKQKITIIFVSHYIEELEEFCDRVLFLNRGVKIVENVSNLKVKFESFLKEFLVDEEKDVDLKLVNQKSRKGSICNFFKKLNFKSKVVKQKNKSVKSVKSNKFRKSKRLSFKNEDVEVKDEE